MKQRRNALGIGWVLAAVFTMGCDTDPGTSTTSSSSAASSSSASSSSSSGDMGGAGGMAGAGGMGGTGGSGGVPCTMNADCDDQNACTTEECKDGFCASVTLDGVPTPGAIDMLGDCNTPQCIGGIDTLVPDNQDAPKNGYDCISEGCADGMVTFTNLPAGTACGTSMTLVCNDNGVCVGCNTGADCGVDTVCQKQTCVGGTCGKDDLPAGTFVDGAQAGDCRKTVCNGVGGTTTAADDTDIPADDGMQCTDEICANGMPVHPFSSAGVQCAQDGGTLCNGGGACVQCLAATDCPGQDTFCQSRSCSLNQCAFSNTPAGTPVPGQTAGDCQHVTCNGAGMAISTADNLDVPADDGSVCTSETCTNGMPTHPPVLDTTPCTQGGGTFCSAGACVQCVVPADCPGMDTQCSTRTCTSDMCGNQYASSSTVLQNQTAGNCQIEHCDGMGGVTSSVDDTDLPVDGEDCTTDICNAGTPSNPPLTLRTSCMQNGGTVCNGRGRCVADATIVSVSPQNNQTGAPVDSAIRISFNTAMNPNSLSGQTADGLCSGSVQISLNDFVSCLGFATSAPAMSSGNTVATFTPARYLSYATNYKVRVMNTVESTDSVPLAATFTQSAGFMTRAADAPCGGSVVISQIYGAGGDLGSLLKYDFVELHNRGDTPVNITGWSVQYTYPTSSFNTNPAFMTTLSGTIAAGGYYLIQLGTDGGGTVNLPTPDAIGTTNFDSATGKVALLRTTTPLTGQCPLANASIVDFVGYGIFTNCYEGTSAAPTPSTNTIANTRINSGCTDTGDNNADFSSDTAAPRNSAATANICSCTSNVTANETGRTDEIDYCNIQFPTVLDVMRGQTTPLIYGRVYELNVTEAAGANPIIRAEIGYGPENVNPLSQSGYVYVPASFNMQYGNDDEYQASLVAPMVAGSYRYIVRFSLNGVSWTYCDLNGAGSNPGLAFDYQDLPRMNVQ